MNRVTERGGLQRGGLGGLQRAFNSAFVVQDRLTGRIAFSLQHFKCIHTQPRADAGSHASARFEIRPGLVRLDVAVSLLQL